MARRQVTHDLLGCDQLPIGVEEPDLAQQRVDVLRVEHNVFSANFNAAGSSAAIGFTPNGDTIENLIGADIHTVDRILPEYQDLKVGDKIPLAQGGFGVPVKILEPGRALVMFGDTRRDRGAIPTLKPADYFATTWGWFLDPVDESATRLIERWRVDWNDSLSNSVFMRAFLEPGAFLMSRKMLLGIKERSERQHSV